MNLLFYRTRPGDGSGAGGGWRADRDSRCGGHHGAGPESAGEIKRKQGNSGVHWCLWGI